MRTHQYYVYILTNTSNKVLSTGVTNDLERRIIQHRKRLVKGFTQRYNIHKLVYYEVFEQIDLAISREKQIKGLLRIKKIQLIEEFNCGWCDLCPDGRVILPERISVNHKNA